MSETNRDEANSVGCAVCGKPIRRTGGDAFLRSKLGARVRSKLGAAASSARWVHFEGEDSADHEAQPPPG